LERHLRSKGFRRFVYSCGHEWQQVAEHLGLDETETWIGDRLVCNSRPDGTGSAVWTALDHVDSDPFVVVNGDTFIDMDYADMVRCHVQTGSVATVAVDNEMRNCGMFVFSRSVFGLMAEMTEAFLLEEVFKVMGEKKVRATWYPVEEKFWDIGSPEGLEKFRKLWAGRISGVARNKRA